MNQEKSRVPVDLAVYIADIVQIRVLAEKESPTKDDLRLIRESAVRLDSILEGRLTPDLKNRMTEVSIKWANEVYPITIEGLANAAASASAPEEIRSGKSNKRSKRRLSTTE
jgi:hypothetical protein